MTADWNTMDKADETQGTEKFGFNVDKENNITYREWAPNATQAFLIGDFSISLSPSSRLPLVAEILIFGR